MAPESYEYNKQAVSECHIVLPYCQLQVVPERQCGTKKDSPEVSELQP